MHATYMSINCEGERKKEREKKKFDNNSNDIVRKSSKS